MPRPAKARAKEEKEEKEGKVTRTKEKERAETMDSNAITTTPPITTLQAEKDARRRWTQPLERQLAGICTHL